MSSHEEFLRAITAHPNSDLPRLRFADWLDDQLDPLGEFIRVQCQLETLIKRKRDFDDLNAEEREIVVALDKRERELLEENEREWIGPIADQARFWTFRRGFVDEIVTTPALFIRHAEAMYRTAPIRIVHFNELGDALPDLVQCPQLTQLRFLDLSGNPVGDRGAFQLATSPQLQRLTGLNLSDAQIGDKGAQALAMSPFLKNLRELYLTDNPIGEFGERELRASSQLRRLETLYLNSGPVFGLGDDEFDSELPF